MLLCLAVVLLAVHAPRMTTMSTPSGELAEVGRLQARVSENVRYLISKRQTSARRLALALGLSSSGMSNRLGGEVEWRTGEIETVAKTLQVPWPWLFLPELDLVRNVNGQRPEGDPGPGVKGATPR